MTRRAGVGAVALAAAVAMMPTAPAQAAPGDPTSGYSDGGALGSASPTAVLAVPGGDVYVAAQHQYSDRILLARFTPSGRDSSFGTDSSSYPPAGVSIPVDMDPTGLARQADGKFVIAGTRPGGTGLVVVRTTADGTLDRTFDGDGQVSVAAPAGAAIRAGKVAVGATGRILVGAVEDAAAGDTLVVRAFGTGGKPDKTFGTVGRAVAFGGSGTTVVAASSGLAPVGLASTGKITTGASQCTAGACSVAVVRLTGKGVADGTFSGDGRADVPLAGLDSPAVADVHSLAGGHVLVVADGGAVDVMARFKPDGTPNTSFDGDGVRTRPTVGPLVASAVQADGKVLTLSRYDFYFETDYQESWPIIRRWNWNGARDNGFGSAHAIPPDYVPTWGQPMGPAVLTGYYPTSMLVGTDNTVTVVNRDIGEQYRAWYTNR